MSSVPVTSAATRGHLDYLPIGLFGSVMGLSGLSVAWSQATAVLSAPHWVANVFAGVAVAAFLAMSVGYLRKAIAAPAAVLAEFQHPIAGSMFGTFFISLLLLPIPLAPIALRLAQVLWIGGAIGMFGLAWLILQRWMSDRQQAIHASPAWIVPIVGLLDVPLAVPSIGLPPLQTLMIACLAIGFFFAIPLFTLIFSRLLFEPPLPMQLQPTLLILVAPFAVGFSAYVTTIGRVDEFAKALYGLSLFILSVMLGRLRLLLQSCPFRVTWWAVSFPLAASATMSIRFAAAEPGRIASALALLMLGAATLAIAALLWRTIVGILRGELRELSS
jgi:tellurite resistance protein